MIIAMSISQVVVLLLMLSPVMTTYHHHPIKRHMNEDKEDKIKRQNKIANFGQHQEKHLASTGDLESSTEILDKKLYIKDDSEQYELDIHGANQATGRVAPELQSKKTNSVTKTYERVVLEGSTISISCPHSTIIVPGTSFTGDHRSRAHGEQKQFAHIASEQQQQKPELQTAPHLDLEQVRWFRNHVPLVNLNHFQPSRHGQLLRPKTLVARSGSEAQTEKRGTAAGMVETVEMELNWTTELSQRTTTTNSVVSGTQQAWRHQQQQQYYDETREQDSSPTPSSSSLVSTGSLADRNVNEFAGFRKRASMPDAPPWYINRFGELVIKRVSKYFAGKYTCLVGGKQSEVLLDVVDIRGDSNLKRTNFKIEQIEEVNGTSLVDPPDPELSSALIELKPSEEYKLNKVTAPGNGPIEKRRGREVRIESSFELSLGDKNNRTAIPTDSANVGAGMFTDHRKESNRSREGGDSQVGSNSSPDVDLTSKTSNDSTKLQRIGDTEGHDWGQSSRELPGRGISGISSFTQPAFKNKDGEEIAPKLHFALQHPVHVIKSETIQLDDIKLVPGFLYTKQQLYCPVTGQTELHIDQIYPLIHRICPTAEQKSFPPRMYGYGGSRGERRCYQLAKHLIWRLVVEGHQSVDCSASIIELVWFKDGKQLKFDSQGRGTNTSINFKLIDSVGSTSIGDKLSSSNDFNLANEGTLDESLEKLAINEQQSINSKNKQPEANQYSQNFPNRWICPPRGRILEIDGIKKDSAGHYTCALRLSISKLDKIIQTLRQQIEPNQPIKWRNFAPLAASAHDNDISCCDEQRSSSNAAPFYPLSQEKQKLKHLSSKLESEIETVTEASDLAPGKQLKNKPIDIAKVSTSNKTTILGKKIAFLDSIILEKIASEKSLSFMENLLSLTERVPLKPVQTFSLVVADKSANSCDLWSTIVEAREAYTRRKLADFKRMKQDSSFQVEAASYPASSFGGSSNANAADSSIDIVAQGPELKAQHISGSDNQPQDDWIALTASVGPFHERNWPSYRSANDSNGMDPNAISSPLLKGKGGGLMSDSIDSSRRGSMSDQSKSESSLLNNSDRQSADVEAYESSQQIEESYKDSGGSSEVEAKSQPFNYANEQNLRPENHLDARFDSMDDDGHEVIEAAQGNGILGRHKKSPTRQTIIGQSHDYFMDETKDLITQRGGQTAEHQGINTWRRDTNFNPLSFNSMAAHSAAILGHPTNPMDWHPTEIDSASEDETRARTRSIIDEPARDDVAAEEVGGRGDEGSRWHTDDISTIEAQSGRDPLYEVARRLDNKAKDQELKEANNVEQTGEALAAETEVATGMEISRDWKDKLQVFSESNPLKSPSSQLNGGPTLSSKRADKTMDSNGSKHNKSGHTMHQQQLNQQQQKLRHERNLDYIKSSSPVSPPKLVTDDFLFTGPLARDDKFDEGLMWTAGQYLYMHMRALAASSMFGLEVAVEWSNERTNGTQIDSDAESRSNLDNSRVETGTDVPVVVDGMNDVGDVPYGHIRDVAPFATIDVISGQSLQLQCTAQAFGRLPEVKWYKRVNAIPFHIKGLNAMVRKIGKDLYWPLTELDLLYSYEHPSKPKSFVCSQTIAVFDNLINQTFTVVNILKLSQYNDKLDRDPKKLIPNSSGRNLNLYACIVDADVRHSYATLGVQFREAPTKIPMDISKRLKARSALKKVPEPQSRVSSTEGSLVDSVTNFNHFRESELQFPLKTSYWVPIQNGSAHEVSSPINSFPITPTILSTIILFVFTSLLGLIYLTLHTYRSLTQSRFEEDLIEESVEDKCGDLELSEALTQDESKYYLYDHANQNALDITIRCPCQIKHSMPNSQDLQLDMAVEEAETESLYMVNKLYVDFDPENSKKPINHRSHLPLYRAHDYNVEVRCTCNDDNAALNHEVPSRNGNDYIACEPFDHLRPVLSSCCQASLVPSISLRPSVPVNLFENPLKRGNDDFLDKLPE